MVGRSQEWHPAPWPMPRDYELVDLCELSSDDEAQLCVPLSPTQNELNHWHYRKRGAYRDACAPLIAWQLQHLGAVGGGGATWARRVRISVVRCSTGTRAADPSNLWAGVKGPIDLLVRSGTFPDDSPAYVELGTVEDRALGHWGELPGPGTYLFVRKLE